jgi:hypothetical protein
MPGTHTPAFQVRAHPQRGHHHPQVRGDRLPAGRPRDRPFLQVPLQLLGLLLCRRDALRLLDVGVQQGAGGAAMAEPTRFATSTRAWLMDSISLRYT